MAIRQGGTTVIDDSRNVVNANAVMLNGDFTPHVGEGPNILWSAAGSLVSTIDNPNAYGDVLNDNFGYSVAADGNYAIVSAYAEEDRYGSISGKAYIYNVVTGSLIRTLDNPNPYSSTNSDYFGYSVAISGNYAIVGAFLEDDAGGTSSGKAYIFNVTTGALVWTLNNPNAYDTSASDYFGWSVSISSNYAIVGAQWEDDANGNSSGKAYIYNITTGALVWTLDNPNVYSTGLNDNFGYSVAISENYAIVGAPNEDQFGSISGKTYVYSTATGALLYQLNPSTQMAGDNFGHAVSASGNYAIVGAPYEGNNDTGKAYIFNLTNGTLLWTLNDPNYFGSDFADRFGFSVSISGNLAIVGAYQEDALVEDDNSGRAYIYNVTTGALVFALNNPNAYSTFFEDWFGFTVAISGNYAIVGAYLEDDAGGTQSGKAYTFALNTTYRTGKPLTTASDFGYVRKNAAGSLVWTLNNPNAYSISSQDFFGEKVAISGNYAIVGTWNEDEVGGVDSGKAYIYNVTTGALLHTLNNPNAYSTSVNDNFGYSVAISGNYAIVGAYNEGDSVGLGSGKAYIFNVTTGALLWTLNNPNAYDTSDSDWFANSVAISGNYAIVGAYNEDDAGGTESGKAYIYNVTTGALVWTLNDPNAFSISAGDQFGSSVAISGNYAIVAAPYEDDVGGFDSGKAYIYNVTTGALLFTLNNPTAFGTSSADYFGFSVSISGNYAIVGAYQEDDAGGSSSGKAYIYNVTSGALVWTLDNPNAYSTSLGDQFGISVAISGNYAIVGSYGEDDTGGTQSGKAYIFSINDTYRLTNVEEIQLANGMKISADNKLLQQSVPAGALIHSLNNPNAYTTSAADYFVVGRMSGNYAIISAFYEDDAGGTNSGKAYIFNVTTGALLFTLNNPNAYSTSLDDNFGSSISISGNYAVISAPLEDDAGGTDSGKVYVYNVTTGALLFTLNNPNAYSTSLGDIFGSSVEVYGNYLAVGATGEDDAGGTSSGKVYVYNVTTGVLLYTLNNPNVYSTSDGDSFGSVRGISGDYVVIQAGGEDSVTQTNIGVIYVFSIASGNLIRTFSLTSVNNIHVSGNYLAISVNVYSSGTVSVYDINTGNLLQTFSNPNAYSQSFGDDFGISTAITGDYLVVGSRYEDSPVQTDHGYVYVFNIKTGTFMYAIRNPEPTIATFAGFGLNISADGNYFISTSYGDSNSGKAYIFSVRDLTYLDRLVQMVS